MPLNAQLRLLLQYESIHKQFLVCIHLRLQLVKLRCGIIDVGMSNKYMRLQQCAMGTVIDEERSSTASIE